MKQAVLGLLAVVCSSWLCACGSRHGATPAALQLPSGSGYLTRAQLLPFLHVTHLTDSAAAWWQQQFPHSTDTIGKYYPANTAGDHILLARLLYTGDTAVHLVAMELSNRGTLLQHTTYWPDDEWCETDGIRSFCKRGRYFFITCCSHGPAYAAQFFYVFDQVRPQSAATRLCYSVYNSMGVPQQLSAVTQVLDTCLLFHYTFQQGSYIGDSLQWGPATTAHVRYTCHGGTWVASDSTLLRNIDMN